MRKTKRVYANYAFFDRTGIQTFLEKQALNGWMLCRKKGSVWHFRRMEPQKLHYSVTYFPGGAETDAEPSEELRELLDFCEHTGWKQAVNGGAMQIFYHDAENPTPIETDALVELNTIHKAVKKEYLKPRLHTLFTILIYLLAHLLPILTIPYENLARYDKILLPIVWLVGATWYGFEIGLYYVWRRKALKAAETDGSFVETHSRPFISGMLCVACYGMVILTVFSMMGRFAPFIIILIAITALAATWSNKSLSKEPKEDETPLRAILSLVATVLCIMVVPMAILAAVCGIVILQEEQKEARAVDTYEYQGDRYEIYADEIPLTIEDLMETDYTSYSYEEMNNHGTFLLEYYQARQQPRQDDPEQPQLRYRIVTVKADFLYDYCKNDMLDYLGDGEWIDSEPWGAEQVYYAHKTDSVTPNRYLLCYPNRLVEIRMDWIPTPEQMTIIAAALD